MCALTGKIKSMDSLQGQVALVTGAAKRIGRTLALTLAGAGAKVAITYRGSEAEAQKTVAELKGLGVEAFAVHCDVRDPQCVEDTVAEVAKWFGRLDLLVNNAGVFETAVLQEISVAQWDAMFETNTRGAVSNGEGGVSAFEGLARTHHQHWVAGWAASVAYARALLHV